jgi:hypothetical protein
VSAFVTVEKWKTLRHVVTETERTANDLLSEAIDSWPEKYGTGPAQPTGRRPSGGSRRLKALAPLYGGPGGPA